MGKDTNFIGKPIFGQLLNFLDKGHIKRVSRELEADKYVKRFTSYKHVVVMLFAVFEGYHSIRDTVLGLLSHASKLQHLGLDYIVRRSTLSDANARRPHELFAKVYYETYSRYKDILSDSNLSKKRWQIELLFKQLKQNFPLKYFLGDNENAIIIQIWAAMIANLLLTILRSKIKKKWAFSNMMSIVKHQLMSYINVYSFFEDSEKSWRKVIAEEKERERMRYQDPQMTLRFT